MFYARTRPIDVRTGEKKYDAYVMRTYIYGSHDTKYMMGSECSPFVHTRKYSDFALQSLILPILPGPYDNHSSAGGGCDDVSRVLPATATRQI